MKPSADRWRLLLVAGGIALVALDLVETVLTEPQARTTQPARQAEARGTVVSGQAGYKYLCYLPGPDALPMPRRPLILFLHGACPDDDLEKLRHFGPIKYALTHPDFPCIVACPASSQFWAVPTLRQLLGHLQTAYPVDPDRVYVTGYSNGGHATWMLASAFPARFAAIAPVAGAGNPQDAARRLHHLPVWIFHGVKDDIVPVTSGRTMAEAMQRAGGEVRTTFYEDLGHDTWAPPYQCDALYAWFLEHRRRAITRSTAGNP